MFASTIKASFLFTGFLNVSKNIDSFFYSLSQLLGEENQMLPAGHPTTSCEAGLAILIPFHFISSPLSATVAQSLILV
ncbi:hypothetical protein Pint_36346 [Pistacia integerrima]|uniref:Uncharacterized protein n=1 Tax=Pistacia integerrima TaxID=434235 RepID=A0ACC0XZ59_9ROSI|nr:hypothetical protein Pint_36346 [Pistacia integerrima]